MSKEQEREKQIASIMKNLEVSREEAIEILLEDEEIDEMTSTKDIEGDLNTEQKKASKQARTTTSEKKKQKKEREKVINVDKVNLIKCLQDALICKGCEIVSTENEERKFRFSDKGITYEITMSVPRKPKA